MKALNTQAELYKKEVEELLGEIETTVLEIEKQPDNKNAINKLFRAMHTIKGSGSMFGFTEISNFTHSVESVLDKVRNENVTIDKNFVDLILSSKDCIHAMVTSGENDTSNQIRNEQITAQLNNFLSGKSKPDNFREDKEITPPVSRLPDIEKKEGFYQIKLLPHDDIFVTGNDPATVIHELSEHGDCKIGIITKDIPPLEGLDTDKCYFSWDIILQSSHDMDTVKDTLSFFDNRYKFRIDVVNDVKNLLRKIRTRKLGKVLKLKKDMLSKELREALVRAKKMREKYAEEKAGNSETIIEHNEERSAITIESHEHPMDNDLTIHPIKILEDRINKIVEISGKLIAVQEQFRRQTDSINKNELSSIIGENEILLNDLRDNVMSMRLVQNVHDLSEEMGDKLSAYKVWKLLTKKSL